MGKPEDISQEAWDAAIAVFGPPNVAVDVEDIARAIMAAKAEEREGVLGWLDAAREGLSALAEGYENAGNRVQAERCIVRAASHTIAAQAIRQGDHVNTAHNKNKLEA